LKPTHCSSPACSGTVVRCDVAAVGTLGAAPEQLAPLRLKPGSSDQRTIPPALLKHADEQTVAAVAAIWQALDRSNLATADFTDWGVVAAPRFLGRTAMHTAVQRFAAEGAWGISPHLIPHRSLHSLSGTLSQALAIHGPNFGVGGGLHAIGEICLSVAALLDGDQLPGVWLVMTGWNTEPRPGSTEVNGSAPKCEAVALALVAAGAAQADWCLRITGQGIAEGPVLTLGTLRSALEAGEPAVWRLPAGGGLELERLTAARRLAG
jgi:hypothetical protein